MLSTTLEEGLRQYAIGEKLRSLRLRKKMGLVELGRHTGLSPALLSKLERGKIYPTLPTLLRISLVFSVGLEYFFEEDRRRHVVAVVRREERLRFPEKMGGRKAAYYFECLDFRALERKLSAYYAEFASGVKGKQESHAHDGIEFLHLLKGRLEIQIGNRVEELKQGDSIYFDSSLPHSYCSAGSKSCAALVVTVP